MSSTLSFGFLARAADTGTKMAAPAASRRVEPGANMIRRLEPVVIGLSLGREATCLGGLLALGGAGGVLASGLEATGVRGAGVTGGGAGGTAGTEAICRGNGIGGFAGLAGAGPEWPAGLGAAGLGGRAGLGGVGVCTLAGLGAAASASRWLDAKRIFLPVG